MAPSAPIRELVFVPGLLIGVEKIELAVAGFAQRPRQLISDKLITFFVGPDGSRMRILLPGVGNFHAMAKEALVAGDISWNRLAAVILRVQAEKAGKDAKNEQASRRVSTRHARVRAPRFISQFSYPI